MSFGVLTHTNGIGVASYYLTIKATAWNYACLAYYRSDASSANAAFDRIGNSHPAFRLNADDTVDLIVPNCAMPCKTENQQCTYGQNQCCSPLVCDENSAVDEDQCMTYGRRRLAEETSSRGEGVIQ